MGSSARGWMEGWGGKCRLSDVVSFWGFGVFWGAVIALTNADTEHPSQETLL